MALHFGLSICQKLEIKLRKQEIYLIEQLKKTIIKEVTITVIVQNVTIFHT